MTKSERDALIQKASILDTIQNILHNATMPGAQAANFLRAQQWVLDEWKQTETILKLEQDRLDQLLEVKEEEIKGAA